MAFAQQDQVIKEDKVKKQDEIKQDQIKQAGEVKTDPSKVSNSRTSSSLSGLDGKSFKITFNAKPAPERKDALSMDADNKKNEVKSEQQAVTPGSTPSVQSGQHNNEQGITKSTDANAPANKQPEQNTAEKPVIQEQNMTHPAPNTTTGQTPDTKQDTRIEPNSTTQTQPPSATQDKTKVEQNNTAAEMQKSQDQNSQPGTVAPVSETNNQNMSADAKPASDYQLLDGKTLVLTFNDDQLEVAGNAIKDGNLTIESCTYNKTSGTGSLCTIVASCMSPGSTERSYWSALIDGSQITGSVYFTNTGTSEEYFKFTGKKTSVSAKKSAARETSSLK